MRSQTGHQQTSGDDLCAVYVDRAELAGMIHLDNAIAGVPPGILLPTDYGTHLSYCLMSPLVQKESRGGAGKRFLASESFTHSKRAFDGLTIASVTAPLRSNFITSLTDGYFGSLDTVLH